MPPASPPPRVPPPALAALLWLLAPGSLIGAAFSSHALGQHGRADLAGITAAHLVFVLGMLSASTVGAVLAVRRPEHPVGWLFLALGSVIAVSVAADAYALPGVIGRPGSLPWADQVAVIGNASFVPWLVLVALVLHVTPTGRPLTPRWRRVAGMTVGAGAVMLAAKLLSGAPLEAPYADVQNPWALRGLAGTVIDVIEVAAGTATGVGVVLAGISLLIRARRAVGTERRQLRWMALVVVPLPLFVAGAFAAAATHHPLGVSLATGGFVVLIPLAAGLSVAQYQLYGVDRLLSRAASYVAVTGVLGATYALVIVLASRALGGVAGRSQVAAVVATLVTVAASSPVYRRIRRSVDRRFNRREFDAVALVRTYVRDPAPGIQIEQLLCRALGDPSVRVSFFVEERSHWVTAAGLPAQDHQPAVAALRHGRQVARVSFEPTAVDRALVDVVVAEALPELDNVRLRAAVALQLVEVQQSRARLASAQVDERRALERNLHDGAQQRLLAMAMQLQAAHLNGDPERARSALLLGVAEAKATVQELRELANGLHPPVLADAGLAGALNDLAARIPLAVEVDVSADRFHDDVESTAWFIACEAVTNAVKHSSAQRIRLAAHRVEDRLLLQVCDDGAGGADAQGRGLRGISDRAEAAGGRLHIISVAGAGTTILAELPCG